MISNTLEMETSSNRLRTTYTFVLSEGLTHFVLIIELALNVEYMHKAINHAACIKTKQSLPSIAATLCGKGHRRPVDIGVAMSFLCVSFDFCHMVCQKPPKSKADFVS